MYGMVIFSTRSLLLRHWGYTHGTGLPHQPLDGGTRGPPAVGRLGVRANLCSKLTRRAGGERLSALASASASASTRFMHSSFPTMFYLDLCL